MSVVRFAPAIHTPRQRQQVSISISALTSHYEINAEPASYAVTGEQAALARGLFVNAEPGAFALSGFDATLEFTAAVVNPVIYRVAAHTPKLRAQVSQAISGLAPTVGAYELNAEPGAYALTGVAATLARDITINAEPATYTLTGIAATTVADRMLACDSGAYTIAGVDATLEFTGVPGTPPNTALIARAHTPKQRVQVSQAISGLAPSAINDYELDAQPGSFAIIGVDVQLAHEVPTTWDRIVSPNYAHTTPQIVFGTRQFYGVEAAVGAYELDAQPGSYAVTGSDATLARGLFVNAETGAYTVTGVNATLARGLFLNAETGVYTITGLAADLPYGVPGLYALQADPGSYVITGVDATLAAARLFTADPASFSVTGIAAGLVLERAVLADPGAYAITGTANAMLLTRVLDAGVGAYVINGEAAGLGDPIVLGFFDQPTPSTDGFDTGPTAGVFDSPTPGVVRT